MRKILIDSLKVIGLQGYSQFTGLVSKVLLARILSVHSFGILSLILLWSSLLAPFLNFGTNKLITKVVSSNNHQKGIERSLGVILWSTLVLFLTSGLVLLLILVLPDFISDWLNVHNWHLYVILTLAIIMAMLQLQFSILNGLSRPAEGRFAQHLVFPTLLILFLLHVYYTFSDYNLDWIIAGYIIIYIICFLTGLILVNRFFIARLGSAKPDFSNRKTWRNFSVFNFLTDNSRIYLSKLDLIFVGLLLTPDLVALYVIPSNIFSTLTIINYNFNMVLEPKISHFYESGKLNRLLPTLRLNIYLQVLLSLLLYAIVYFLGGYILLLFGEEYAAMHKILQITSLSLIIQAIAGPAGVLLTMSGKVKERLFINLISLVAASICYPIFIHQYGLTGAAFTFVCTMLLSRIGHIFLVNKVLKINLLKLMTSIKN